MKVLRTDRELEAPGIDAGLRARGVDLALLPDAISEEALAREVRDADLLLMCYTPITARVIEGATRLKGIVKYGVGIDAIDIEAARRRNIPVVNVPEYAEETVAEGAFALMIALARKLRPIGHEMDARGWAWPVERWMGSDLSGKTLGIVGLGRIGRNLARMAGQGFRMRVLGFDPYVTEAEMRSAHVERRVDLKAMLGECDFVSVHCVLNAETRHLLGAAELACLKPTAFLVNVSRGAIVDEQALVRSLAEGRMAGVALDVYGLEPLKHSGHPMSALFAMDNAILLPHLTFFTREAMARLERDTLERCREILEGRPVLVKSRDPRLRSQSHGVMFPE